VPIHLNRMDNYQGISHPGELRGLNRSAITEAGLYPNRMDVLAQSGTDAGVDSCCKK
jgi:hypothetical protein